MNQIAELFKWLLERDIRAKNALSVLVALVAVVIFYFLQRNSGWFQDLERYGEVGIAVALLVVFFIAFLSVSLLYSVVTTRSRQRASLEEAKNNRNAAIQFKRASEKQRRRTIRDTLDSLTDWQRKFLLRFIVEGRTQIPGFEVGEYRAAWDFEMAVLIEKGIVREHRRAGVYEIVPAYLDYLRENWDSEAGTLG